MGEGRAPPATGLLFIDGSWFIDSKFFFFNLPHCQALINIHEFPALAYLSSQRRSGAGKERVLAAMGGRVDGEEWGLSGIAFSPRGSSSKLQLARWGRFSANTEIPQCLLLFFPGGKRRYVCCFLSSDYSTGLETCYPETPAAQEGAGDPSDVP